MFWCRTGIGKFALYFFCRIVAPIVFLSAGFVAFREAALFNYQVPSPYEFGRIEKQLNLIRDSRGMFGVCLLPSWLVRYALYRDRFGEYQFYDSEEVIQGRIQPFRFLVLVDLNHKYGYYKKRISKIYKVTPIAGADGDVAYYLLESRVKKVVGLENMSRDDIDCKVGYLAISSEEENEIFRLYKGSYEGYSRRAFQARVSIDRPVEIRIRLRDRFNQMIIVYGINDGELFSYRTKKAEIEAYVDAVGKTKKQFRIRSLLGIRTEIIVANFLPSDIVDIRFSSLGHHPEAFNYEVYFQQN